MKLFLDTEFTDLVKDNKLISIALVDENREYFYAELSDTYRLEDCSEFVKAEVLPWLRNGEYLMTSAECSVRIADWIESRNTQCILAMDNPLWDRPHLANLLKHNWPKNLLIHLYYPVYVSDLDEESLMLKHKFVKHNALDDAMLMSLAGKIGK